METLAQTKANQIPELRSVPGAPDDRIERVYETLLTQRGPVVGVAQATWAAAVTKKNQDFLGGVRAAGQARRELARRDVGQMENWDEALKMATGPDSFIGSLVLATLTNGERGQPGNRSRYSLSVSDEEPVLRHFSSGDPLLHR